MTPGPLRIEIANQQTALPIDEARLAGVAESILADAGYHAGELSIAVVDDPTIHELNRRHLEHDYPTDVLSFVLEESEGSLQGEVIVSADTAITNAEEYGWPAENELLLYVIHGTLHLVGHRDKSDEETRAMRDAEARYLASQGVALPDSSAQPPGAISK